MAPDTRVGVIGLGYVGLPLAIAFVEAGLEVEGIDASPARVEELNARHSPIDDITDERLAAALERGLTVVSPAATARAAKLLANVNDRVIEMSSPDAAEMSKLLENTFRNVNIAFVNQLALLCERMGLDVWEVIDAASTKPFGFMRFTPGPGVGGHCIPVDPYYLAWRAREFDFTERFIELAGDINFGMPRHVVDLVAEALNDRSKALKGARVGVIGVAFKPDVQDARNSPAGAILPLLAERGGVIRYHDPLIPSFRDDDGTVHEGATLDELLAWADVLVVVTAHRSIDWAHVYERADLVVDTVNSSSTRVEGPVRPRQVLRLGAGWS
jgi:UDP-N-acetyl-D-glucosamine dehydrogenase